jgi:cation:H+ antiporter
VLMSSGRSNAGSRHVTYLVFALGLAGLFFGGNWLVQGASAIALRLRISPLVIGLTVVGFGTSTPELLVSLQAALRGASGIAIGNVVGSNIANILLILGIAAVIGPFTASLSALRRDLGWMLGAALITLPAFWGGMVGRWEGAALTLGILLYVTICLRQAGTEEAPAIAPAPVWKSTLVVLAGLATLLVGARLLVDSATDIARTFGVSEAVIGLTIVAVGTSLPELATSVVAAIRGERDIALGNVVGSNVFNILAILGITALVAPIPVEARFLAVDAPVMIAVSLLLVGTIWLGRGMGRAAGALFLALYLAYVAAMSLT